MVIDVIEKLLEKIYSRKIRRYCRKCTEGEGFVRGGRYDHVIIENDAKLILHGNLYLNTRSRGGNGRASNLRMGEGSRLFAKGDFKFFFGAEIALQKGAKLYLGSNSFVNCNCKIYCRKEIHIGDNCAISHDFTVLDSDVHSFCGNRNTSPVTIGDHVWICSRVMVLSGVTIGDGAVVAAGAVVTKDVPPRCLAAGVPARVIKENVDWEL